MTKAEIKKKFAEFEAKSMSADSRAQLQSKEIPILLSKDKMKVMILYLITVFMISISSPSIAAGTLEEGMKELAQKIVKNSMENNKKTIAISSFQHTNSDISELSNYLADELVLKLFSAPGSNLEIIERGQLNNIFKELQLSMTDAVDKTTIKKIGKIHGVDALVLGSITEMGESIRINARLTATETGRVFSAAGTTIPKTSTITELLSKILTVNSSSSTTVNPSVSNFDSGAISKKSGNTNSNTYNLDLSKYQVGDLLDEIGGKDVITVLRNGEKGVQGLNDEGIFLIENLELKEEFQVNFAIDWSDPFNQSVSLQSKNGETIKIIFMKKSYTSSAIKFGNTQKDTDSTTWEGNTNINDFRLVVKGRAAKLFINDTFFGTSIVKEDAVYSNFLIKNIKQNDFVSDIVISSL